MIKPKRLVVMNQSAGYLMVDIINANSEEYEEVVLITGHYNPRQAPLKGKIFVKNIVSYNRRSSTTRILTWIVAYLQLCIYALRYQRNSHFLIVSNPPMSFFIPLKWVTSYSLLVYDIYPDALIHNNFIKYTHPLIWIWTKLNKRVFRKANSIYTLSEGMKSILSKYGDSSKIKVVPVWTDNRFLKPINRSDNPFFKNHSYLCDKFIVQYSGNIGETHHVEALLEIASCMEIKEVHFLIIGEGTKKSELQKKARDLNLLNVTFLPWQKTSILPFSLSAADICVVSISKEASHLSVPSKTYNLMSVGAPTLCIANRESELANLVAKYDFGKSFDACDIEGMKMFIQSLFLQPDLKTYYSKNALRASEYFTPQNASRIV